MPDPSEPAYQTLSSSEFEKVTLYLMGILSRELELHPPPANDYLKTVQQWAEKAYTQTKLQLESKTKQHIIQQVVDELAGYGPIQSLLEDPEISEIMVDGCYKIYVERNGVLDDTQITFQNEEHLFRIINRILSPLGRRVDADNPTADARLPDGSRVNIIIPPVAIEGPHVTIRKFLKNKLTMEQLLEMGSLTDHMVEFLKACVVARLNILISGNTSSGKTTLLNILTSYIPGHERIITIEDAVELQLKQKYIVRLETKHANLDGKGEVTARELVRNSLRMRPDRIIVGEVRSGEALDMLQAMNTGHSGSITTLHANSPRDALSRLETMVLMAGLDLPLVAIRRQMASAINLIVHLTRLQDGTRKVTHITEVSGMESDIISTQDIFKFEQSGVTPEGKIKGELKAKGIRPIFTPRLEMAGFKLKGDVFGVGSR